MYDIIEAMVIDSAFDAMMEEAVEDYEDAEEYDDDIGEMIDFLDTTEV